MTVIDQAINKMLDSRVYELQADEDEEEEIQLIDGKWFEGFAIGEFTDMFGREIEITEEDLDFYLKNTRKAIKATRELESEEIGGLPIDARDHERGEAAGWIVSVKMSDEGDKLLFKPKWTVIGQDLLKTKLMRHFSATFSLEDMVIMGGTLTNWPATREDSVSILAPIELTESKIATVVKKTLINLGLLKNSDNIEGVQRMTKTKVDIKDLTEDQVAELGLQYVQSELGKDEKVTNLSDYMELEIEKRSDEKIEAQLVLHKRNAEIANFVQSVTEGTEEAPVALAIPSDKLTELLEGIGDDMRDLAYVIFKAILDKGIVDFSEKGTDETTNGKTELPKEIQTALDDKTLKVENLSMSSMGLGDIGEYNLSKWQKEGK